MAEKIDSVEEWKNSGKKLEFKSEQEWDQHKEETKDYDKFWSEMSTTEIRSVMPRDVGKKRVNRLVFEDNGSVTIVSNAWGLEENITSIEFLKNYDTDYVFNSSQIEELKKHDIDVADLIPREKKLTTKN